MHLHPWLITSIGGALLATACSGGETYVLATITRGNVPADTAILGLETTIDLGGRMDMTPVLSPAAGAEMTLPATLSLEIGSGDGLAVIAANAFGDGGTLVAAGSTEVLVARGDTTPVTIELGRNIALPTDGGPDDDGGMDTSALSVDPRLLPYGTRTIGTQHDTVVTVSNGGGGASMPLEVAVAVGQGSPQYAIADNLCEGVELASGASCSFRARFQPTTIGPSAATIEVLPYRTITAVGLSGAGVLFSLTPSSLMFGSVSTGTPVSQTVTVTNESTSMTTQALGLGVTGPNATEFSIDTAASTCTAGQTLAPTTSCTVIVRFSPVSTGSKNAFLDVTDRATMSLALSGTGI